MHGHPLGDRAAAEREDVVHQALAALAGLHDLVELVFDRATIGRLALRHLAIAEDGTEDVVEVVRDAARGGADGCHLLRATQLFFRRTRATSACLRSLMSRTGDGRNALALPESAHADLDREHGSVLAAMATLEPGRLVSLEALADRLPEDFVGVRVDVEQALADQLVACIAETGASLSVDIEQVSVLVLEEERIDR